MGLTAFADPPGRRTIAVTGSHGWVEVWDHAEGGFRVEHHVPTKEASVGIVDRPEVIVTNDWEPAVRRLLTDVQVDVGEMIERLIGRWR